jgi:hypothetical protein
MTTEWNTEYADYLDLVDYLEDHVNALKTAEPDWYDARQMLEQVTAARHRLHDIELVLYGERGNTLAE